MKIFLILFTVILIVSCSQKSALETDDLSQPVVEISPVSNQTAENNPFPATEPIAVVTKELPDFPTPERMTMEDFLRKENRMISKRFGLENLEEKPTANDDIEVRIWQITDLYMRVYKGLGVKESVFILKRTSGNWSAVVFRKMVNQKSDAEKQIKTKLDEPKSGWESIWQNLVNNKLLTFSDSVKGSLINGTDEGTLIFESKVGGIYKTYQYSGSQKSEVARHTVKILNVVADEFNLEDFQMTKEYEK